MTEEQIKKGREVLDKIKAREGILEELGGILEELGKSEKIPLGFYLGGNPKSFYRNCEEVLDPAIHKACVAMIRQSIADDIEKLRKELAAL